MAGVEVPAMAWTGGGSWRAKGALAALLLLVAAGEVRAQPAGEADDPFAAARETVVLVERMLTSLDDAIAGLEQIAVDYVDRADRAQSLAERQGFERLFADANRQLGELRAERARIVDLQAELHTLLGSAEDEPDS